MEESGLSGGNVLRALVFLTIAGTVLQAGLTAGFVARWLGVQLPTREGVAILGAQGLGFLLAEELRKGGTPVVLPCPFLRVLWHRGGAQPHLRRIRRTERARGDQRPGTLGGAGGRVVRRSRKAN